MTQQSSIVTNQSGPTLRIWRGEALFATLVFVALALLPVFLGGYIVYILPQYLTFGVLAMSLALLWGFTGILSFGQAGFFAVGGYAAGLLPMDFHACFEAYLGGEWRLFDPTDDIPPEHRELIKAFDQTPARHTHSVGLIQSFLKLALSPIGCRPAARALKLLSPLLPNARFPSANGGQYMM